MSANYPPPGGQNPYGQPQQPQQPYQPSPYAAPTPGGAPGAPGAPAAPGGFNGAAYAPPAPIGQAPSNKLGAAILVGVVAMIAGLFIYAGIMRASAHDDGSHTEIGYVALAVGLLVGAVVGKVGGRHEALPIVAGVLSILGVFLGEFVGYSMIMSHALEANHILNISWFKILTDHTSDVWKQYKHDFDFKTFLFLAIAGVEGFVVTRRVAS